MSHILKRIMSQTENWKKGANKRFNFDGFFRGDATQNPQIKLIVRAKALPSYNRKMLNTDN